MPLSQIFQGTKEKTFEVVTFFNYRLKGQVKKVLNDIALGRNTNTGEQKA